MNINQPGFFRISLAAILGVLFVMPATYAQEMTVQPLRAKDNKAQIVARLEKAIPRLLDEGIVPGLSVAVIQKGELAYARGFGVKQADKAEPVQADTVFDAASLSKPVFAYAVLKLVDAGKLDLDKPLNQYLPGNYDAGENPRLAQITARHVLSHTTGFPNWRGNSKILPIFFTPGERFSYSGEGFVYLAKVVEHITGEKFNDFMQRMVFDPLGMKDSSYVWRAVYATQAVYNHSGTGQHTGQNRSPQANAAASLRTTANDYGRFLVAVLRGTGLKMATRRLMLTPQIKVSAKGTNNTMRAPEKLSETLSWGLGWGLQSTKDGLAFWHWGDNGNTKAYVVVYDKQQLGMVVFTNSANGLGIIPEIVNEAIGGEQAGLTWLDYESYRSPGKSLFRKILTQGAATALPQYRVASVKANESQINSVGYGLLQLKRFKDAIEVFKLNTETYPQSSNAWSSLGEAYLADGNQELARQSYQRAVELNPQNQKANEALDKLKAQK